MHFVVKHNPPGMSSHTPIHEYLKTSLVEKLALYEANQHVQPDSHYFDIGGRHGGPLDLA